MEHATSGQTSETEGGIGNALRPLSDYESDAQTPSHGGIVDADGIYKQGAEDARATQAKAQREFLETEKAYGGREAYDKAKAEGKTKLNYQQWVQVRTPAFKAWFGDWEAAAHNAEVNRKIEQWAQGDLAANVILNLGRPSSVLTEYGVPNFPITLRQAVLRKAVKDKHDVDVADLKDLARSIQSPLAIFDDAEQPNTRIVITEIRHNEGNVIAAIRMNMKRDGLEINDIRSLHPKRDRSILNWVEKVCCLDWKKVKVAHGLRTWPRPIRSSLKSCRPLRSFYTPLTTSATYPRSSTRTPASRWWCITALVLMCLITGKIGT